MPIIEDYKLNVAGFISTDTQEGGATEERKENSEKHYKLLIIEDNQELRQLLTEVFSDLYNVETAENGKKDMKKLSLLYPTSLSVMLLCRRCPEQSYVRN